MAKNDFELSARVGKRARLKVRCWGVSPGDARRFVELFEKAFVQIPRWARRVIMQGWRWRRQLGLTDFPVVTLATRDRWCAQIKRRCAPSRGMYQAGHGYFFCNCLLKNEPDQTILAVVGHEAAHDFQIADDGLAVLGKYTICEIEENADQWCKAWGFDVGLLSTNNKQVAARAAPEHSLFYGDFVMSTEKMEVKNHQSEQAVAAFVADHGGDVKDFMAPELDALKALLAADELAKAQRARITEAAARLDALDAQIDQAKSDYHSRHSEADLDGAEQAAATLKDLRGARTKAGDALAERLKELDRIQDGFDDHAGLSDLEAEYRQARDEAQRLLGRLRICNEAKRRADDAFFSVNLSCKKFKKVVK